MQDPTLLLFVATLFAVVFAVSVSRELRRGAARDRAIRRVASGRGWRYSAQDPAGLGRLRFRAFGEARRALVTNVVSLGDADVRVFDYSLQFEHEDGRGDGALVSALADEVFDTDTPTARRTTQSYTRRRSAGVVRVDAFLPPLAATPASLLTRAVERAGVRDHDVESLEFNRHWDVRSGDERFAWLFFDASMVDLVLELGHGTTIETFGNHVLVDRPLLDEAGDVERFVDVLARLPGALNPLVRQEYPSVTTMGL